MNLLPLPTEQEQLLSDAKLHRRNEERLSNANPSETTTLTYCGLEVILNHATGTFYLLDTTGG